MISIENLSKSFGPQVIFDQVDFKINPREKIGLVGRNGHGKTTFFKLLIGQGQPDEGRISVPSNYRIGYVRQEIEFTRETVVEECMTGLAAEEKDCFWKAEKILEGLGFSGEDMKKDPYTFSGGYQVRLNLAKVIVSEPDLLLLDEPTNYLDIVSIRWVERFLQGWQRELIVITHDRSFMDRVVTHTAGIYRKKIRKIVGNTGKFYDQIALDEEVYEKTRINEERKRRETELFISRFRAKARLAGLVQSRIKTIEKLEKHEKAEFSKTLNFSFRSLPYKGKVAMHVKDIAFSWDKTDSLFENLNFTVSAGDRLCVVGKNGKGKTTLLKILAKELVSNHGEVVYSPGINAGFFEQGHIMQLNDERTVEEEVLYSHPDVDRQTARNICGAMMFEGDNALKKTGVISGGEKSRVVLGKLLATPVNLLLLDEPTNHLDMESCDALMNAINEFSGAVVMVTHNEMFLHTLAERLIVFRNNSVDCFESNYRSFLDSGGWHDEGIQAAAEEKNIQPSASNEKITKKEVRKIRSAIITKRSKVLKPLEKKIEDIESEIVAMEVGLEEFNRLMQEASLAGDGKWIQTISQDIHRCRTSIDHLFDELEAIMKQLEKERIIFEKEMAALESE
ncbi:MAG: ATP-binding cassette domain-containing protein [Deltaproteobacteria bacterium]|nr:ATP-binding cassette domain-containing protein [Deltaproteobacteria bacterium]